MSAQTDYFSHIKLPKKNGVNIAPGDPQTILYAEYILAMIFNSNLIG